MKKTRTKVNLRFLACILVASAILGVGVHLVHGYQIKRNASVLLHMANKAKEDAESARKDAGKAREDKDAIKEKEFSAKEKELRAKEMDFLARYLGFAPKDVDALTRYGESLDDRAKSAGSPRARMDAYVKLDYVLRLDPGRRTIRRRQVDTAMYFGKFHEALTHLQMLHESAPTDAELERLIARCQLASGNIEEARKAYEQAIEHAPDQINNYLELAVLYHERIKNPVAADQKMAELVKHGKPEFRAYLTRANYYLQLEGKDPKKLSQAKADLKQARELAPNEPDVVLATAEAERVQESPDQARKALQQGIQAHPRDARLYLSLINLEIREERMKEALGAARAGLKELKDVPDEQKSDLLHALADLLVQSGELQEADEVMARLEKLPKIPRSLLDYLKARLFVRKGKWAEAGKLLEEVQAKLSRVPGLELQALLLLGDCHEQLGNPDQALLAYQRANKLDPLSIRVRYRIGSLFMLLGRTEEALAEFRSILTAPKIPVGMHVTLARALITLNQRLIAQNPRLPEKDRNLQEIHRELALVDKDGVDYPILKAETILLEDKTQTNAARLVIESAREKHPDELGFVLALAQLSKREDALRILLDAQARPKFANRVELQLVRLGYQMQELALTKSPEQRKKTTESIRPMLAELEKEASKLSEADRSRLFNGLADAHLRLGDTADAERLWKQVADQQPNNLSIRLVLFDLALVMKSPEAMDRLLDQMRGIEGENGVYWRYAKASRLLQEAQPPQKEELSDTGRRLLRQARQYLVEAARLRTSWPRIPVLEAQIDELEDNVSAAIGKYQHAIELGERRPAILRKTVDLLWKQGRIDEAKQTALKLSDQESTILSAGLGKLAAEGLLSTPGLSDRDAERARDLAVKAVAPNSNSYQDHLWLGRVQWATAMRNETDQAARLAETEKSLRRACDLAEKSPETWVTLVAFLTSTDKKKEAEKVIEQAKKKLPADQAPLALAMCYDNVGDLKKAEENYLAALKAAPENGRLLHLAATFYIRHNQFAQAEPRLRAILQLKGDQSKDDVTWARRALAAVLAANRSKTKFEEALKLIDANLQTNESSLPDKHAKALLLATRISKRKDAIRLFEELARNGPLPANEQFTLAQLYVEDNEWEKGHTQMTILLSKPEGNNPTYEAYFTRALLQHGDINGAEEELAKLKKAVPDAPLTRELEARILWAKEKYDDSVAAVNKFAADGKDADLVRIAMFLESLGQKGKGRERSLAEAEAMYRKHARQSDKPDRFLPLASFLGRRRKVDEALGYCEEARKNKAAPQAIAQTVTNILRDGAAGAEQCSRVEKWLKGILDQAPESVPVMTYLADVYDYQSRFDDAEKLYRQALQRDANNVFVLNNLAWLLAFKGAGSREEGLTAVQKAIELVGEGPELLDTRGVIYLMMGRSDQALKDLQEVVARAPSANRFFHLSLAQDMAHNSRDANVAWNSAKKDGFDEKKIHPLERSLYEKLRFDLGN